MKRLWKSFRTSQSTTRQEIPGHNVPVNASRRNNDRSKSTSPAQVTSCISLATNHPQSNQPVPSTSSAVSQNGVSSTAPIPLKGPLIHKPAASQLPAQRTSGAVTTSGSTSSVQQTGPSTSIPVAMVEPLAPSLTRSTSATFVRPCFHQGPVPGYNSNEEQKEPKTRIPKPEVTSPHHEEKLLEELTCSVCMDLYTDPMLFPCLHSLCSSCVKNLRDNFKVLKCPDCRRVVRDCEVKSNFPLRNLVEIFRTDFQARQPVQNIDVNRRLNDTLRRIQKQSKKTPPPRCPCCDTSPGRFATVRCLQCKMMFCDSCLVMYHPTVETTADHTLEQVNTRQRNERGTQSTEDHNHSVSDIQFQEQERVVLQSMEIVRQQLTEGFNNWT